MDKQLLFLAIILIASLEATTSVVRGDLVCETATLECMFKCYTGSGKCLRCCQGHGYVDGVCNFIRANLCYCCNNTDNPPPATAAGRHGWQPQTGVPTPIIPHFL
uniref:Uncharacterized protein n=1 Tax=Avena sativa TaxID=4498 RepID=A0ACD5TZ51_AVESA